MTGGINLCADGLLTPLNSQREETPQPRPVKDASCGWFIFSSSSVSSCSSPSKGHPQLMTWSDTLAPVQGPPTSSDK